VKRILIVDDDDSLRRAISRQLTAHGYKTALASSGQEALLSLDSHPADLIVLDMMMPEMTGPEFLKVLQASPQQSKTPVIIITAHDIAIAVFNFRAFKVEKIIPKGVGFPDALLATTREILGKQSG